MDQKHYWKTKWENRKDRGTNLFAKRCFKKIKKKHKTLLDLGCGDGRDSLYFAKKGMHVTAVDFSKSGIDRLKQRDIKNVKVLQKDFRRLNFKPNSLDVIYAHLSLHYFDDKNTAKIFDKLHKLLRKGGMIFIKCKSTDDSLYGKGKKAGENMFIKGHLRHFFDKGYMEEKLDSFKIKSIRKTSSTYHRYRSSFIEAVAIK